MAAAGLFVVGLPLFAMPWLIVHRSGSIQVGLVGVMTVLVITLLLAILHEGIHGAVMAAFGARPMFGVTLIARAVPAMYTTSPGHRLSRLQYVAVAASPALVLSALGLWATLAVWGGYLIVPLAAHLGGCVGDGAAIWRVLRQPQGTLCEDLRDGVRFYRPLSVELTDHQYEAD